ncbi:MAG: SDR family oxidoreductase [Candidatus Pacebacteria bacterium]|nr:SDR family oxidoreductase [Candidatus Paceibacterota bacterium]
MANKTKNKIKSKEESSFHSQRPPQHQKKQPGRSYKMNPEPVYDLDYYRGTGKLEDKIAIVTGGDSGIGRSVSLLFAREGADVTVVYLEETQDAKQTKKLVEEEGQRCLLVRGDLSQPDFCQEVAQKTLAEFGQINILVNNAAEQHVTSDFSRIAPEQLKQTFATNFYSYFYLSQEVVSQMKEGDSIINTTSVTAYRGSGHLIDYASTKGAIVAFTRSLAKLLARRKIRVNAVAPGPIWTPLIPASFPAESVAQFGQDVPLGRAGQPIEVAPAYVYLASQDGSYITGQVMHPNGGEMVGS